jgi:hypothetical protein
MARLAGRNGRIYLSLTSGGTAEPVAYQASWSINFSTNKIDVTAMGDSNKVYVSGLQDAQGQFAGFYDDASVQAYTAATDGVARKVYIYPNISTAQYWFGTALTDFSVDSSVDGAVAVSSSWAAASVFQKIG